MSFQVGVFQTNFQQVVVVDAVVAEVVRRGGGGKKKHGKRPLYWWEKEKPVELRPPFKQLPSRPIVETALRAQAEEEVKAAYRRKRKRMLVALAALLDD